jgi:hypothetical protein
VARRKDCYTDEEKDEIIAHVLVGVACGRYISRIFAEDATTATGVKIPAESTFWLWMFQDESDELSEKLARARQAGIEVRLSECEEIADDSVNDYVLKKYGDDGERWEYAAEHVQRSKLRIDTRIKLAQMMKPKTYGPSLDLTSGREKIGALEALRIAEERDRKLTERRSKGED